MSRLNWGARALLPVSLLAGSLAAASVAQAHHSFTGVFKPGDEFEVSGTVTVVRMKNPHATFDVTVADGKGGNKTYLFELHSAVQMMRQGWKRDSLKVGDKVKVRATRARANPNFGFVSWIEFSDGRKLNS